ASLALAFLFGVGALLSHNTGIRMAPQIEPEPLVTESIPPVVQKTPVSMVEGEGAVPKPTLVGSSLYQKQIDEYIRLADIQAKSANHKQKWAYLTFDDGPSRNNTLKNLETLKKYGVKATFFTLPHDSIDDVYKKILDEGHDIGIHSFSHDTKRLYTKDLDFFKTDFYKANQFLYERFHYTTKLYRFPGGTGGRKASVVSPRAEFLAMNGYTYFDWNVSVADTDLNLSKGRTVDEIVDKLTQNVLERTGHRRQLIVLMHDDATKIYTAMALSGIIEGLKKQGYSFDVLSNYYK
ncbi:MAG: polysaccharide deacetylase family protein, partial [Clostridia bacterium]|nr:polysaccharide deacetylase family protein [Clostridia bacterium]